MAYIDRVLQPGEVIRHLAVIHWIIYLPGLLVLAASALLLVAAPQSWRGSGLINWTAAMGAGAALILLGRAWFRRWTTEIAVTNRRIIFKRGFIRRYTIEMNMDKVESVDVDQSILGRIFDYGDVIVRGTGMGLNPLRNIDAPLEFRNHVTAA
jgi:uncharacterized membrane protein YdbT with pleckstrin-like domain